MVDRETVIADDPQRPPGLTTVWPEPFKLHANALAKGGTLSTLQRGFKRLQRALGPGGLIVAIIAVVLALGAGAYAASGGLTGKQKEEVKKIARKFAGRNGANGAAGPAGPGGQPGAAGAQGATGQPDTSNFYDKAGADSRFAQINPTTASQGAIYTNDVIISPADGTTPTPVLTLPGGFTVDCLSNGTNSSRVQVVGTSPWSGNVLYNEGATMINAGVGNAVGGTAIFGVSAYGTARYQIMDSAGATPPTRLWTITVTIIRGASTGITGGPYCNAEAIAGPA